MDTDTEDNFDSFLEELDTDNMGEDKEELASQISQLQELVYEMKEGFTQAMQALSSMQYEEHRDKIELRHEDYDARLKDVVAMVISLKDEFGNFTQQLKEANENQDRLQKQVQVLQLERDILLEELEKHGSISQQLRDKYHSGKSRPNGLSRSSDTSLSVLLDRAQNGYHDNMLSQNNSHTSDQDSGVNTYRQGDMSSCGEVTPPTGSPMVQSYIDSLQDPLEVVEDGYESDSSLTAAANKSLDISRSLGDECAKLTHVDSSDEEDDTQQDTSKLSDLSKQSTEETSSTTNQGSDRKMAPHERNNKDMLRSRVAREILDTERKYCNCLWTVLDHFAAPLKQAGIASSKDIATMFPGCLYLIYEHHCKFLQRLEERLCNWRWQGVLGDVLSRFFDPVNCDLLKQYKNYVKEFPAALQQMKKACRHSMRFRKFIKRSQSHPCCEGLDLASFLLTPIQRVPRYVLLFKQLLKHTEQEHPDYYHIETSLQRLGAFLADLNNSIEDSMNVVRSDTTPKPKKKIRMGSFRSSSISSYDAQQISTATRDSGIQSTGDKDSLKSSSSGRAFQLAAFREGDQESIISGAPSSLANISYQNGSIMDYESLTLPNRKTKKLRSRERRSKTDEIHTSLQGVTAPLPARSLPLPESNAYQRSGRTRPLSASDHIPLDGINTTQRLMTPSPNRPPSSAFSEGSESLSAYMARSRHSPAPLPPSGGTPGYVSSMFNASASMKSLPEEMYIQQRSAMSRSSLHYSMPGIFNPSDLGIYGDDDEADSSNCQPLLDDSVTRQSQKLTVRSKSHGELLPRATPGSPTHQQLVQSLAQSLSEPTSRPPHLDISAIIETAEPLEIKKHPKSVNQPAMNGRVSQKPPRPRSAVVPSPIPPDRPRDNVWDESTLDASNMNITLDSTFNTSNAGNKKKFQIKRWVRGKDKERRYHPAAAAAAAAEINTSTLSMKDKKKGFKNSIKDIFKKRKSDINASTCSAVDLSHTEPPDPPETADYVLIEPVSTRIMELDHSDIQDEDEEGSSPQKQEADNSVVLVSVKQQSQVPTQTLTPSSTTPQKAAQTKQPTPNTPQTEPQQAGVNPPELVTFDENGDPCSAV